MKKKLLTALVTMLGTAAAVYGQGSIFVGNNLTGFRAPIYNTDPNPNGTSGQSSLGTPAGSTVYTTPLLGAAGGGSGYTYAFFAGPTSASSNALTLFFSTTFRTATGNALPAGLVNSGTATITGVNAGDQAHFQIRVWNNQGGTITTWSAAEAAWLAGLTSAGVSLVGTTAALGGTDTGGNPVVTPIANGYTSFSLTQVPEPATLTLAGLGAAALMIFRRRK